MLASKIGQEIISVRAWVNEDWGDGSKTKLGFQSFIIMPRGLLVIFSPGETTLYTYR